MLILSAHESFYSDVCASGAYIPDLLCHDALTALPLLWSSSPPSLADLLPLLTNPADLSSRFPLYSMCSALCSQVTLAGSTFDTVLAVYTGTNSSTVSTLSRVVSNDQCNGSADYSCVTFVAVPCQPYWLQVDGWGGARGNVSVSIATISASPSPSPSPSVTASRSVSPSPTPSASLPPLNDAFANADAQVPGVGSTVRATYEMGEPRIAYSSSGGSIWFVVRALCNPETALTRLSVRGIRLFQNQLLAACWLGDFGPFGWMTWRWSKAAHHAAAHAVHAPFRSS